MLTYEESTMIFDCLRAYTQFSDKSYNINN